MRAVLLTLLLTAVSAAGAFSGTHEDWLPLAALDDPPSRAEGTSSRGEPLDAPQSGNFVMITTAVGHQQSGFGIDHTTDIMNVPVRFFTSRPEEYLSWRFSVAYHAPLSATTGRGLVGRLGLWRSDYWLNWEIPGLIALDPLESSLTGGFIEAGPLFYLERGRFLVEPFLTARLSYTSFKVEIEGNEGNGGSALFGMSAGLGTAVRVTGAVYVSLEYAATWDLGGGHEYELEEAVTLPGEFEGPGHELHLGLSFRMGVR